MKMQAFSFFLLIAAILFLSIFRLEAGKESSKSSIVVLQNKESTYFYSSHGVSPKSQFYVGSISKQITAFMLLQTLAEKNPKASLNEILDVPLDELFPQSILLQHVGASWKGNVTLLNLLTHRSGLSDYIKDFEEHQRAEDLNHPMNAETLLKWLTFDPQKPYLYSNTNYFLLGKLIEEMRGQSYEQAFELLVKGPTHMTDSFAPHKGNYFDLKNDPKFAHLQSNLNEEIFIDFANVGGAGGIISSASDLLKWNQFLHFTTEKDVRETMLFSYDFEENGDAVHLGLATERTPWGSCIGFQGSLDSFASALLYFPEKETSVVILSNNRQDYEASVRWFDDQLSKF